MTPEKPAPTLPAEPEKVLGAERLEETRLNAEFWFNAGHKEPDHDRAVMYLAQAMFAWKNAAYGISTQLSNALSALTAERGRREAAEAVIAAAKADANVANTLIAEDAAVFMERAEALTKTLHKYGNHLQDCAHLDDWESACNCGYDAALVASSHG